MNFGTTVSQLQALNRITNPDLIIAGQRIRVK
ncbi:LysM domain-containing protein [Neobacillus sp. PS3-12]|nr:LysM domain-containing protein [Neobacillus sp. PS3-12]WML53495.1 LysM domain-containing protein [Neobacillus sp. PS3-12]